MAVSTVEHTGGMPSIDARVVRTRAVVLEAGARLLFTDGWHAVTHLRVAEEAGVGRATMYRHWPTVEDLLADVLVDCQEPWGAGEPTGDLRVDLITELDVFVGGLQHSKLPEIIVAAMERAPTDPRIRAMHDSMTQISRDPVWTVVSGAIERGQLDSGLDEPTAAAHTLGPILYQCLFDNAPITPTDIERTIDAFLAAFAT
ncbi:MAG: TetR/AcrR family transcriptional regulator [Chloroflexi bacterium]|nr:TetR/AcrR family transcriptional regulator [Chloroflexota bacterium]MBT7468392.1 TetR/AcrR family transcriptional regulator [Chloroflexota bacterium]